MRETSLLYNIKAHFPILKTYLEQMESKVKKDNIKKIQNFQSKQAHIQTVDTPKAEDVVCQVCNSGDNDDKNLIVYCSLCNISVHQQCYVIPTIPEGDFICDLCHHFGPEGRFVRCPLCSCRGGAMRPTKFTATPMFDKKNESYAAFMKSKAAAAEPFWPAQYLAFVEKVKSLQAETNNKADRPHFPNHFPKNFVYEPANRVELDTYLALTKRNKGKKESEVKTKKIKRTSKAGKRGRFRRGRSSGKESITKERVQPPKVTEMLYDFYRENFQFTPKELENEPVPQFVWTHLSCLYWIPEVQISAVEQTYEIKNLGQIERWRFSLCCSLCDQINGACITCHHDNCSVNFHVECARRARLYLCIKCQGSHVCYCADHTPLLFTNVMYIQEKREREEILKFTRTMRRFIRTKRPDLRDKEICHSWKETDEADYTDIKEEPRLRGSRKARQERHKPEMIEFLKFIDFSTRRMLTKIKFELVRDEEFFDRLLLRKLEQNWTIIGFSQGSKKVLENKIARSSPVFVNVAKQLDSTVTAIYGQYNRTFTHLQNLRESGAEKPLTTEVTSGGGGDGPTAAAVSDEVESQNQIHCICQQPWHGEVMIKCDRCELWFHPKCIGVIEMEDSELENCYMLCVDCRNSFRKDFALELINPEIYMC